MSNEIEIMVVVGLTMFVNGVVWFLQLRRYREVNALLRYLHGYSALLGLVLRKHELLHALPDIENSESANTTMNVWMPDNSQFIVTTHDNFATYVQEWKPDNVACVVFPTEVLHPARR